MDEIEIPEEIAAMLRQLTANDGGTPEVSRERIIREAAVDRRG